MKNYMIKLLALLLVAGSSVRCVDDFIEAPYEMGLDLKKTFSSAKNAEGTIALAYAYMLSAGLPMFTWSPPRMPFATNESFMSGENLCSMYYTYEPGLCGNGMSATGPEMLKGAALSDDNFTDNYVYIRHTCVVLENIDKVPDMSVEQKSTVKGEMKGLLAFRYLEMLKRYGGVPLVDRTLTMTDRMGRATVQQTIDFILRLCRESKELLGDHQWSNEWTGRLFKGVVLAIEAETLTYAARPLFNNTAPYLDMHPNNDLIWLGGYDEQRYRDAIKANLDVIEWGKQNGYALINTGNPMEDFGTAVGTLNSREILLAFKQNSHGPGESDGVHVNYSPNLQGNNNDIQYRGTSYEMLKQFRKADGTEQTWPRETPEPYMTGYYDRAFEMEPRCKASIFFFGIDPFGNPEDDFWSVSKGWKMYKADPLQGVGRNIKFWYKAGRRDWFEYPIYRMAEFYLNLAECYNELGDDVNARLWLNDIRTRGGLAKVDYTDPDVLQREIEREWSVEFYNEGQLYPHARHWKKGAELIGGPKHAFNFTKNVSGGARTPKEFDKVSLVPAYTSKYAWFDKMNLSPIVQSEINKGYLVQNPGY